MHLRITTPDDLHALSGHLQDSLVPRDLISWDDKNKEFTMILNRYIWEKHEHERINSCIYFHNVSRVQTQSIDAVKGQRIFNLLTMRFDEGKIICYFSDHRSLAIQVERLDAEFWDYDNSWPVEKQPKHLHEYVGR